MQLERPWYRALGFDDQLRLALTHKESSGNESYHDYHPALQSFERGNEHEKQPWRNFMFANAVSSGVSGRRAMAMPHIGRKRALAGHRKTEAFQPDDCGNRY
jgi:hypothetical protein